ncbi:DUF7836 family putative zinc-binding protein [Halomarina ordinaria]|uniref:DUF7836 domain-containing protein n=1 Tax=Halomarina ordinaria TaxID=3033939 RepID=A0ABD5UBX4_9EURY|nr:hypothetical protein [Halomarina sp. PSRA2]
MPHEHTAYVETLVHLNCGNCDGYWGLSDVDLDELSNLDLFCTHCGHETEIGEFVEGEGS